MFVPEKIMEYAYENRPLPIGYEQTISQPYIVAIMTEQLGTKPGEKILEIGTGSGYQAAILDKMGCRVYTIEIIEPLGKKTKMNLISLGFDKINCKIGDGYKGWNEYAHSSINQNMLQFPTQNLKRPFLSGTGLE